MKTLSIKNPFAYLICHGFKNVENRTWKTKYRGKILIHVSGETMSHCKHVGFWIPKKSYNLLWSYTEKYKNGMTLDQIRKEVDKTTQQIIDFRNIVEEKNKKLGQSYLKSQCIIGEVDLIDIITDSNSDWAEFNCYHWILKNPKLYKNPIINIKGKLGLWNYEKEA